MSFSRQPSGQEFIRFLRHPEQLLNASPETQDLMVRIARRQGLLARLGDELRQRKLLDTCPPRLVRQFEGAFTIAQVHARMLRWEVNRIQRATEDCPGPLVLFKGAAYLLGGHDWARERLVSDVDILVDRSCLPCIEKGLKEHGWEAVKLDEYDQRYYRDWMHEIPPLRHSYRATEVDVHHNILPPTGRRRPDPQRLLKDATPLPGDELRLATLCPADMVLHNTAHLFQDGDFRSGLRQLLDLDGMLTTFSTADGFWENLRDRAQDMDLARPLYYGLLMASRILRTPIPPKIIEDMNQIGGPNPLLRVVMVHLMGHLLIPTHPDKTNRSAAMAGWLLYLRSHWLRMPPLLLARHLWIKSRRKDPGKRQATV